MHNRYQRKRFNTEYRLIKGTHQNDNKHPSIIYFSVNKAATQYVKSILQRCGVENRMVPVGIHEYAFNTNFPYLDLLSAKQMGKYKHIFKETGYLYGPFGGMIEGIPNLDRYKIVLVTRDPRDLLVSEYYSVAYSHVAPSMKGNKYDVFKTKRSRTRELSIDEYVISESGRICDIFARYQSLLLDHFANAYVTTYEYMVFDFEAWLADLILYCEFDVSPSVLEFLITENMHKKPKKEDIHKHNRKGQPGDYKEKLKPETIQRLNETFNPILTRYHYNPSSMDQEAANH
ncbi:hypothetical protein DSCO28_33440 [Desulfosarcina ovata subsp. sediminis]|uniref:Sulfotransferase domain-containing protein n=1 Tax=Desulfosarcina ovata subsp. sediminis TaxID=885957 RepID=A0A5K7ZKL3_9BACT|nr:hypothetical protein DSCO28_33440 [Desulfosarcina ovata subsp. sediminis]